MKSYLDTDQRFEGYVVSADVEQPSHIFGRPHPLYQVVLELSNPYLCDEILREIESAIGAHASADELPAIRRQLSPTITFQSIHKPDLTVDLNTGALVEVTGRLSLKPSHAGDTFWLNAEFSFIDAVQRDEVVEEEGDELFNF